MLVRQVRDWDIANHGRDHLDRHEIPELLRADADVIHRPEDRERVWHAFAKTDQNVADQQFAQGRGESFHNTEKVRS